MGRAGAKRGKQAEDESPKDHSASKKRRTEKKKIAPKKVEREVDPYLKSFSEKFKQPEDAIQFLIQNAKMTVADFIKDHWGKKPLAMHSDEASKDLGKIFTYEFLEEIVGNSENGDVELIPERDFTFSKIVDKKRKDSDVSEITKEILKKHYEEEKFSVLINEPERFQDCIWAFMEKLETYLASLVTCQALFVPKDTQSHPIRYEDTEKFILQLTGSTSWKLYSQKGDPVDAFNDDLRPEDIGDECLAATLKAGDVLYIPRGLIFESRGEETGVFLDFGTSQNLNYANLLVQTLNGVIEDQIVVSQDLRQALPPGYLLRPSLVSKEDYADSLTKLTESIKSRKQPLPLAESLIQTFMSGRLPPFGVPKFEPEMSARVSKDSKISLKNREHITWFVRKATDAVMDEDDADEESSGSRDLSPPAELVVLSSMNNDRGRHMMIDAALNDIEADAFSMAVEYKELLEKLEKSEEPIKVKSLTEGIEKGDSLDPLVLANALNNIGAINVSK